MAAPTRVVCRAIVDLTSQPPGTSAGCEEEEEVFIASGNWRCKDNSLSRYGGRTRQETVPLLSSSCGGALFY